MLDKSLYVLVAEPVRARIYRAHTQGDAVDMVYEQMTYSGGDGPASSQGLDAEQDAARLESQDSFCRDLRQKLEGEYLTGKDSELVVISTSQFMDRLLANLAGKCREAIIDTIQRDEIRIPDQEVARLVSSRWASA